MSADLPRALNPLSWLSRLACWWLDIDYSEWERLKQPSARGQEPQSLLPAPVIAPVPGKAECPEADRVAGWDAPAWIEGPASPFSPGLPVSVSIPPSPTGGARDMHLMGWRTIEETCGKLGSWNSFDVFKLKAETNGWPLFNISVATLDRAGLLEGWKLKRKNVENFFYTLESRYSRDNPYHNNTHAADVVQAAYAIASSSSLPQLSRLEMFSLIVAAAVHDVEHPGFNNDFVVKRGTHWAVVYNDRSVNENRHTSLAFQIAASAENNIFEGFTQPEFKKMRKFIIDMVISTDMALHFGLMAKSRSTRDVFPDIRDWEDVSLILQLMLHLADISNPARPFPRAFAWAEMVVAEFLRQGDEERRLGMPVTSFCDRRLVKMPQSQLGFIRTYLQPTMEVCGHVAPRVMAMVCKNLVVTTAKWEEMIRDSQ